MATIKKKPRKPTGYQARPWLKLIPRVQPTISNRARLYLPSGVLTLDAEITASPVTMSLDEAATVTFTVADPSGSLDALALAATDERELLSGVDVRWRRIWWRITRIERDEQAWLVVCEDRVAAYLRAHKRVVTASRSKATRAQFVRRLVLGVKAGGGIPMYIPELREKQGIYKPKELKAKKTAKSDAVDTSGVDGTVWGDSGSGGSSGGGGWGNAGSKVRVKRTQANSTQLKTIDEALRELQSIGVHRRVMIAAVCTMTQESVCGMDVVSDSGRHEGPFHQEVGRGWAKTSASAKSAAQSARRFATGGDLGAPGWKQKFGSTQATVHAGLNLGGMIDAVQVAGTPAAFGQWEREATATVDLWLDRNKGGGSSTTAGAASGPEDADRYYRGQYKFRTSDGEPMNWWDSTGALADEVQWHRWAVCNTLGFATDGEMIRGNAVLRISRDIEAVHQLRWTWDSRREASSLTATVALTDPLAVLPGMVAMVDDEEPVSGRWLVDSIDVDPTTGSLAEITFRRPGAKLLEPAPELKLRKESKATIGGKGDYGVYGDDGEGDTAGPSRDETTGGEPNGRGLVYPAAKRGSNGGGAAAHGARAWGNWQSDNAVDINLPKGTHIYAVADGVVTKLGGKWNGGSGNPDGWNVTLRTAGNQWFYTHLMERSPAIRVGTRVKAGQYLGRSGAANGVEHLHIGCEKGDPVKLLGV